MIEQRTQVWNVISQNALVFYKGRRGVYPCHVRDIHSNGAGLHLHDVQIFPLDFYLSFDGFRIVRECHIKWLDGYNCGVSFSQYRPLISPHPRSGN